MPFRSKKQNAWGHTEAGMEALGGPAKVKEWEGETEYNTLPDKVSKNKKSFNYAPKVRSSYTKDQRVA